MNAEAVLYKPDTDGRKPLVIGASGSVGRHVARRLALTTPLYAGARRPEDLARLAAMSPNIIPVKLDVTSQEDLKRVFDLGISTVFNLAANVANATNLAESQRVNVGGAQLLVDEANKAGIRHMNHVSTRGVYGVQEKTPVDEDAPHNGTSPYAITKSEQERIIRQGADNFTVSVVRPADIIGEDMDTWTHLFLNLINGVEFKGDFRNEWIGKMMSVVPVERLPVPLSMIALVATKAVFVPIEVENLVDLMLLAAQSKEAEGQVFNGVDSHTTFGQMINAYARGVFDKTTYKQKDFNIDVTTGAISGVLGFAGDLLKSAQIKEIANYFNDSNYRLSGEKAKEVLGYEPRITVAESIRQTREYVNRNGLIRTRQLYR